MKMTYDMQCKAVTLAEEATPGITTAFENSDFVTLNKVDVDDLISLLQEIVDQKGLIDRDDPRCISYERLVDIKGGVPYPTMMAKSSHSHTSHFAK